MWGRFPFWPIFFSTGLKPPPRQESPSIKKIPQKKNPTNYWGLQACFTLGCKNPSKTKYFMKLTWCLQSWNLSTIKEIKRLPEGLTARLPLQKSDRKPIEQRFFLKWKEYEERETGKRARKRNTWKFSWLRKPRKHFRVSVDDISLRKQLA